MNIRIYVILSVASVIINSYGSPSARISPEKLKSELLAVEKEFCAMAICLGLSRSWDIDYILNII